MVLEKADSGFAGNGVHWPETVAVHAAAAAAAWIWHCRTTDIYCRWQDKKWKNGASWDHYKVLFKTITIFAFMECFRKKSWRNFILWKCIFVHMLKFKIG